MFPACLYPGGPSHPETGYYREGEEEGGSQNIRSTTPFILSGTKEAEMIQQTIPAAWLLELFVGEPIITASENIKKYFTEMISEEDQGKKGSPHLT